MNKLSHQMLLLLCMVLLPGWLYAQDKAISGNITDAGGVPLQNVNILVKQSNLGTTTDANGHFKLSVPANATVIISAVGFKSQTIKAAEIQTDLQIKLTEDVARLDEVVVTGLATNVKRRNLANAVATISGKQLDGIAPAQTFDAAINGKITGAYINANTGAPGGGVSVKLRGVTSIFGNTQPLYVVDGVFMDNKATPAGLNAATSASSGGNSSNQDTPSKRIADISAEDIANIEIVKGTSAAA